MQISRTITRDKILPAIIVALFAAFVIMLPRYTDTAKIWFALLILIATVYLGFHLRELGRTSSLERAFLAVVVANFLWIAFCFYVNGEPGRGDSFLWGRHFYLLFLVPVFVMLRNIRIPDSTLVLVMFCSVALSLGDIVLDLLQNVNHRVQGMNPNAFGPIQLCLAAMLFFYFLRLPAGKIRWVALTGSVTGIANVVLSLSKSTLITLAVLSVFFVFYLARRVPAWKKMVGAGLILALIASSFAIPMVGKRIDQVTKSIESYYASDDYRDDARLGTFGTRMELWRTGWQIFLENPWTGVGVGGFQVMARANSERYQVHPVVGIFKYAHNQYLAALATRGIPGLILFLLFLALPLYIAMSKQAADGETEAARLSLMFICMNYLVGCLGEDHFEGKSATMMVTVFVALLLARLSTAQADPARTGDAAP
jgi:O-antigen ligase